ncbi:MAG: HD domain-containing protein [Actinomycetes bacterium]
MTVLGDRYVDAIGYAATVHAAQLRKGSDVPYLAHLLGVSSLVLEAGGDEELAVAALLHDAAEDHGGEAQLVEISDRFGGRVASIVRECSDSLLPEGADKPDWETRKREHLARLPHASDDTLMVWTADKVHNSRALVTDVAVHGLGFLERFHAPPDRLLWYYRSNLDLVRARRVSAELVVPLSMAVSALAALIESEVTTGT